MIEENKSLLSDEEIRKLADTINAPISEELIATLGSPLTEEQEKATMEEIIDVIKQVYDPEIPINIYDLGLIYKLEQAENGNLYVEMTLTTPTCPIAGEMPRIVATSLAFNEKIGEVTVKIVWEPAWDLNKLTPEAKEILELM